MRFPAPNPADENPTGLFEEIDNDGAELKPAVNQQLLSQ
jgi:hypothetical protein